MPFNIVSVSGSSAKSCHSADSHLCAVSQSHVHISHPRDRRWKMSVAGRNNVRRIPEDRALALSKRILARTHKPISPRRAPVKCLA